jgi:hypothetical protein
MDIDRMVKEADQKKRNYWLKEWSRYLYL